MARDGREPRQAKAILEPQVKGERMKFKSWFVCAAILVFGARMSVGGEATDTARMWASVYEKCKGSIMQVEIARPDGGGWSLAMGSAFLITEDGYALSNRHVMGDGQGDRKVIFYDGRKYPFTIIEIGKTIDVALIKLDTGGEDVAFHPLKIGRSKTLCVGEPAAALGSPGGKGLTICPGTVTALNQGSSYQWGGSADWRDDMIRTDAHIIGGNSGGAFINARGEVIGVVCNSRGWEKDANFALPIDAVVSALPGIVNVEDRNDFVMGLTVDPVPVPTITEVAEGSPARAVGLKPGDAIAALNGRKMTTGMDYGVALLDCRPGDVVPVSVRRDGLILEKHMTLERVKPIPAIKVERLSKGLNFKFSATGYGEVSDFKNLKPDEIGTLDTFRIDPYTGRDGFRMLFEGCIRVPAEGKYTFYTTSDDASVLFIGDRLVVDNTGLHAPFERSGVVTLAAGLHPIRVEYAEAAGGETLVVSYAGPGLAKQIIPASALFRTPTSGVEPGLEAEPDAMPEAETSAPVQPDDE